MKLKVYNCGWPKPLLGGQSGFSAWTLSAMFPSLASSCCLSELVWLHWASVWRLCAVTYCEPMSGAYVLCCEQCLVPVCCVSYVSGVCVMCCEPMSGASDHLWTNVWCLCCVVNQCLAPAWWVVNQCLVPIWWEVNQCLVPVWCVVNHRLVPVCCFVNLSWKWWVSRFNPVYPRATNAVHRGKRRLQRKLGCFRKKIDSLLLLLFLVFSKYFLDSLPDCLRQLCI